MLGSTRPFASDYGTRQSVVLEKGTALFGTRLCLCRRALNARPVSEPNNWILHQLRLCVQELTRRASAVSCDRVGLYSIQ